MFKLSQISCYISKIQVTGYLLMCMSEQCIGISLMTRLSPVATIDHKYYCESKQIGNREYVWDHYQ